MEKDNQTVKVYDMRDVTMIPTNAGIIPDRASHSSLITHHLSFDSPPQRVGLFVDEMPQNIITKVVNFKLDVVLMHGSESPTVIRNLRATIDPEIHPGIQFWKSVSISTPADIDVCKAYEDCVDAFVVNDDKVLSLPEVYQYLNEK